MPFQHPDGRVIHALRYELEPEQGHREELIVWLREDGQAELAIIEPLPPNRTIVTTKPGQTLRHNGRTRKVLAVEVYR